MKSPITASSHGVLRHVITGLKIALPLAMKINGKSRNQHLAIVGALSVLKFISPSGSNGNNIISEKSHKKADQAFLLGLGLVGVYNLIKGDKKALKLHLGVLASAVVNYAMNDYEE